MLTVFNGSNTVTVDVSVDGSIIVTDGACSITIDGKYDKEICEYLGYHDIDYEELEAAREERDDFRKSYEQAWRELNDTENELSAAESSISEMTDTIEELEEEIENLKSKIDEKDKWIEYLSDMK